MCMINGCLLQRSTLWCCMLLVDHGGQSISASTRDTTSQTARRSLECVGSRRVTPHIRQKGEQPLLGQVRGKPRRWVVERTGSWHNRFRVLLIRWERKAKNYLALVHLACAIIVLQQSG
jgi:hypothetical protein